MNAATKKSSLAAQTPRVRAESYKSMDESENELREHTD
jgi:hypothetical protein